MAALLGSAAGRGDKWDPASWVSVHLKGQAWTQNYMAEVFWHWDHQNRLSEEVCRVPAPLASVFPELSLICFWFVSYFGAYPD